LSEIHFVSYKKGIPFVYVLPIKRNKVLYSITYMDRVEKPDPVSLGILNMPINN